MSPQTGTEQGEFLLNADRHVFNGGQGVLPTADKMIAGIHATERLRPRMEAAISAGDEAALALAGITNTAFSQLRALLEAWQPFDAGPYEG